MNFNIANPNKEITNIELNNLLEYYNYQLPQIYIDFLKYSNGYLSINSDLIYGSEDINERNEYYKINKYTSNYIAVGDNDGTDIYLMLKNTYSKKVFIVDSISIAMQNCSPKIKFENFYEFIKFISKYRFDDDLDCYNLCLIEPINDISTIIKIKDIFSYTGTIKSLLDGCRHTPFIIRENITFGLSQRLIKESPEISRNIRIVKTD